MVLVQKGVHASLVTRLRKSMRDELLECHRRGDSIEPKDLATANKLDAIGEALAYIIEKKHTKRKIKIGKKLVKKNKKTSR
jgi:hypothetical protein